MKNQKIKALILAFFLIVSCATTKKNGGEKVKTTIYCMPNNMTTYNRGILTFPFEYKKYGIKIEVDNATFETELYKKLPKRPRSYGKFGLRIKIVTSKNDTIFMSYLPRARIIYKGKSIRGTPELLHLVTSKIKEHYEQEDFVCEGSKCTKEIKQKNIDFFNRVLKNCEEYINKED